MSDVWLPLQGPSGERPKAPAVAGWQSPTYEGVDPRAHEGWIGLRTDGLVVVDCDSAEAAAAWRERSGGAQTWVRKTPRGFHFIYEAGEGAPDGPRAGILPGVDIRAGRTSQIVFRGEGYSDVTTAAEMRRYNNAWLPTQRQLLDDADEWTEMPEGRGNSTLTAIAGTLRKQGMAYEGILRALLAMNRLTMTRDPMPTDQVELIARSVSRYTPDPDIDFEEEPDVDFEVTDELPEDGAPVKRPRFIDARNMPELPPTPWLWPPYLPDGRMILLEGAEGIGKGMMATWLATRVATGDPFEVGGARREPRRVMWFTAEDDPQEDIRPRLKSADYYDGRKREAIMFADVAFGLPHFPANIDHMRRWMEAAKPGLVILDPGRSFLAPPEGMKSESSYNNEAVLRPGLQSLLHLSQELHTTLVFVHHWNKKSEGSARDKSGGSVVFRQVVRHVIVLAKVGEHRAFSVDKSNISKTENSVRSFGVVEAGDSARFALGQPLPEYRDLDAWIKVAEKKDGEFDIPEEMQLADVRDHYALVDCGNPAPTVRQIATDFAVTKEEAQRLRNDLVRARLIDSQGRWLGCRGGQN